MARLPNDDQVVDRATLIEYLQTLADQTRSRELDMELNLASEDLIGTAAHLLEIHPMFEGEPSWRYIARLFSAALIYE